MDSDQAAEARRGRGQGDPRFTPNDRVILRRITTGDLADEYAEALAQACVDDPLLGGSPSDR